MQQEPRAETREGVQRCACFAHSTEMALHRLMPIVRGLLLPLPRTRRVYRAIAPSCACALRHLRLGASGPLEYTSTRLGNMSFRYVPGCRKVRWSGAWSGDAVSCVMEWLSVVLFRGSLLRRNHGKSCFTSLHFCGKPKTRNKELFECSKTERAGPSAPRAPYDRHELYSTARVRPPPSRPLPTPMTTMLPTSSPVPAPSLLTEHCPQRRMPHDRTICARTTNPNPIPPPRKSDMLGRVIVLARRPLRRSWPSLPRPARCLSRAGI